MTQFQPIHFIPRARKDAILTLPVQTLITGPHHQDAGTNHWCFFLVTSPTTFVQLDCLPSYSVPSEILVGGSKANLVVSELEESVLPNVQERFTLDIARSLSLTVKDIIDILVQSGRHKYEFDPNGVGCRFWVTEQVELFYQKGILADKDQVDSVKPAIVTLWPDQTPLPLDQGAYYE